MKFKFLTLSRLDFVGFFGQELPFGAMPYNCMHIISVQEAMVSLGTRKGMSFKESKDTRSQFREFVRVFGQFCQRGNNVFALKTLTQYKTFSFSDISVLP